MPAAALTDGFIMPRELVKLLSDGRLPHAVVLESAQAQERQNAALVLSLWAVCCGKEQKPCMQCAGCKKAKDGIHPDIYTAQSSGKTQVISVDEIRKICSDAYIKPNEAQTKVYLLFDADKMLPPAQNAFLKVLEEPPQNILFILTCQNAENLLQTIRSRVTVFSLDTQSVEAKEHSEADAKIYEHALILTQALCAKKESELLEATAKLSDKQFAAQVLVQFAQIARQALVLRYKTEDNAPQQAHNLSRCIKIPGLLNLLSITNTALIRLERNVNMTLFSAWLSSTLREQKYI